MQQQNNRWMQERSKGQSINAAAYAAAPVDCDKLSKKTVQPLQLFQVAFLEECSLDRLMQNTPCRCVVRSPERLEGNQFRHACLQELFDCELKQRCLQQGLLGAGTGYDTTKAAAESARADVCNWEGVYTSAEDGSFSQSLADVNLSKARGKLQKLEQQAQAQLQSILETKKAMLHDVGLFKAHWMSERKKARCI